MVKDHLDKEFDEFYRNTNIIPEQDKHIPAIRQTLYLVWMKGYTQALRNSLKDIDKIGEPILGRRK